jgi:hypothetical protein
LTSSPALTLPVRSAVTPAISDLAVATGASTMAAFQLVLELVHGLAQAVDVGAIERGQHLGALDLDRLLTMSSPCAEASLPLSPRQFALQPRTWSSTAAHGPGSSPAHLERAGDAAERGFHALHIGSALSPVTPRRGARRPPRRLRRRC